MSLSVMLVPLAIAVRSELKNVRVQIETEVDETFLTKHKTYYKLKTQIKDEQLLQEALQHIGSETSQIDKHIKSIIGDVQVIFYKENDGTFSSLFHEHIDVRDAEQFIHNVFEQYTSIVQQKTYEKLIKRARQEGLILESESRQDESIVLTFQVRD